MPLTQEESSQNFQRKFLVFIVLVFLVLLLIFASPFLIDLLIAGVLVAAVYPIHKRILKLVKARKSLASLISILLLTLVVLLPFSLFAVFIAHEAGDAYTLISGRINEIVVNEDVQDPATFLSAIPGGDKIADLLQYVPVTTEDILTTFGESVGQISTFLLSQTTNIIKHLSILLLHVIVFFMIIFYFLRDGDRLVAYLKSLLPLSGVYKEELFTKLSQLSYGIIYGVFGAAILQGFLVGLAFWAAGFNNAAFWGAIAALFAPLPFIGPMTVWIPALIILVIGGKWITGILFLLWCMMVVGTADNFIKPYLIGASSALNPLALLIMILGGTLVFGLKGLIFGPLVLTLTLSFLHIYQLEYRRILQTTNESHPELPFDPPPPPPPPAAPPPTLFEKAKKLIVNKD